MKKFYISFVCVILINLILLFIGEIKGNKIVSKTNSGIKVGLVFDVGGRGDKSFNDSAYNGLMKAAKDFGINYEYIEPGEGADRESALRILAARKFDLIVGIGFIFTDDVTNIAKEYTNVKFACVDYARGEDIPANVAGLKFKEEEGSYLVGAIAALCSKTNTVGFVGGMDIPLIRKFEAGYTAGAEAVKPGIKILSNYAGVTGAAFKDPAKGKELSLSQYNNSADIIFHASGSTGLGVFEAARGLNESGFKDKKENYTKFAIGVDANQYFEAPGSILTSMLKKVDVAVYDIIKDCVENKFQGGQKLLGLKEDGVGFVYDEYNKYLISAQVYNKVMELRQNIIDGKISVPSTMDFKK